MLVLEKDNLKEEGGRGLSIQQHPQTGFWVWIDTLTLAACWTIQLPSLSLTSPLGGRREGRCWAHYWEPSGLCSTALQDTSMWQAGRARGSEWCNNVTESKPQGQGAESTMTLGPQHAMPPHHPGSTAPATDRWLKTRKTAGVPFKLPKASPGAWPTVGEQGHLPLPFSLFHLSCLAAVSLPTIQQDP